MKTVLKVATILTWFNLLLWGLLIVMLALASLAMKATPLSFVLVLLSAIPLNCYAALQLQKSIRQPATRLSNQTPTGIRFVGFVALFFAINFVVNGITLTGNSKAAVKIFNDEMAQVKGAERLHVTVGYFQGLGALIIFLGLCIGVNVVLNFRLLRWYYLVRQSDVP
jgi:hypothetical protein